jgi:hypothetical protein
VYNIKAKTLSKTNTLVLTRFLILVGFVSLIPFYIHAQWIAGPMVNALLILALFIVGTREAFILALIPSLMALSGGLIPLILAPVVPFIMFSNIIFIYLIDRFSILLKNSDKSYWLGLFIASFTKFIFLYFSVNVIAKILINQELIAKVAQMMAWPQFFTAFSGGMIAFIFLKFIKRI